MIMTKIEENTKYWFMKFDVLYVTKTVKLILMYF